ncbi:MAG: ATP-binding protein, partial [Roseiflexaceae bacterium]
GNAIQAVPLGERYDDRVELSLRLAERDPWANLEVGHTLGQLVAGTVVGVQPYGVFVEIAPGVTGLLHGSRLPDWAPKQNLEELFWPGDRVRVVIERIDPQNRQLALSLRRAWNRRWQDRANLAEDTATYIPPATPMVAAEHAGESPISMLPAWKILVVEDDLPQLDAVARWLRQNGHQATAAGSAEEAFELLEVEVFDLLLTDFGLPGMSGVEALQRITDRWPALRCALMTDWTRATEQQSAIEDLRARGVQLLIKPLRPDDIIDLMLANFTPPEEHADGQFHQEADPAPALAMVPPVSSQPTPRPRLGDVLARLCRTTGAAKAILFAFDPAQRKISIAAERGVSKINQDALGDLIHSLVRDVVEDGMSIRLDDAEASESRVRFLKPLLPFRACLGLRLEIRLTESYALFLFADQPRAFSSAHQEHAEATALALATVLEYEQFQQQALEIQRLALLGQMSRALVHEMNHRLSPINFVLTDMQAQITELNQRANQPHADLSHGFAEVNETLQDLIKSVDNLTDTARMFGHVAMQSRDTTMDLGRMLVEVVQMLRDMADRAHVQLQLSLCDAMPRVLAQEVQLQQMLLNVTINAIQQIQLVRSQQGGTVLLSAALHHQQHRPMVRIQIEDDGPGIHRQYWQRIFDLGFTTRVEGGSGIGLYITHSLAETMGGCVSITSSEILWGTTFVIDLPLAA